MPDETVFEHSDPEAPKGQEAAPSSGTPHVTLVLAHGGLSDRARHRKQSLMRYLRDRRMKGEDVVVVRDYSPAFLIATAEPRATATTEDALAASIDEFADLLDAELSQGAEPSQEEAAMSADIDAIIARLDEGMPKLLREMDEIRDRLRRPLAV